MNFPWALSLALEDAPVLARLRLVAGLEVGEDGATIWLRGQRADEALEAKLAGLPAREKYEWLLPNDLRAIDQRIPARRLPNLTWQPLNGWLMAESPTAALPGSFLANLQPSTFNLQPLTDASGRVNLRLIRSSFELEPELLLTSLGEFKPFASTTAQARLDRLRFAVNAEESVIVRGRPLPPLPGRRFVLHGPVAVPAGFTWQPSVSAEVLARRFAISGDALVLWTEDGTITRLHAEQFVPASRSALRATKSAMATST